MSDDLVLIPPTKDKNFEQLVKSIYDILVQYLKDQKNPESWIPYYSEVLNLKFPKFTFNEGLTPFCERVIKVLDLMDISHLYVKISSPKLYNKETHSTVVYVKKFITAELEKLSLMEFEELREHLKSSILYGNN
jgi:hypothetical protein